MLYVLYSIHAEKGNEILMIKGSGFKGFRWRLCRILDDDMKESEKERLKCAVYESTLSTADAVPLPHAGKAKGCGALRRFL